MEPPGAENDAALSRIVPSASRRYLAWLGARRRSKLVLTNGDGGPTARWRRRNWLQPARGRLDRLDRGAAGSLQVIDYKTGECRCVEAARVRPGPLARLLRRALEPGVTSGALPGSTGRPERAAARGTPGVAGTAAVELWCASSARRDQRACAPTRRCASARRNRCAGCCGEHAACAGATIGAYGQHRPPTASTAAAPTPNASTPSPATAAQRRRSRPAPAPARPDAGLAHRARAARRRRAAPGAGPSPSDAQGGRRDARAARRLAGPVSPTSQWTTPRAAELRLRGLDRAGAAAAGARARAPAAAAAAGGARHRACLPRLVAQLPGTPAGAAGPPGPAAAPRG